jgi:multidrug efflux pump subunit AcrA (membrane-fusion protein)
LAKLAIILAIITALLGGLWRYNEGVRDQGRAEIELEWSDANKEQLARWAAERDKLEREKTALARKYQAELARRQAAQAALDKEREDAIRASGVAALQCFDERMRDNWNRDSGHGGPAAPGPAR